MKKPLVDYDAAWKEALKTYFPAFMDFFVPRVYADIDWSRGHEFLDQELRQAVLKANLGKRRVDKLVKLGWPIPGLAPRSLWGRRLGLFRRHPLSRGKIE